MAPSEPVPETDGSATRASPPVGRRMVIRAAVIGAGVAATAALAGRVMGLPEGIPQADQPADPTGDRGRTGRVRDSTQATGAGSADGDRSGSGRRGTQQPAEDRGEHQPSQPSDAEVERSGRTTDRDSPRSADPQDAGGDSGDGHGDTGSDGPSDGQPDGAGDSGDPDDSGNGGHDGPHHGPPPIVTTADVPVGGGVVLAQYRVVVTQPSSGEFRCFGSRCTHAGCTVDTVEAGVIHCPCHGSLFDAITGDPVAGPAPSPLASVPIKVKNGGVFLA